MAQYTSLTLAQIRDLMALFATQVQRFSTMAGGAANSSFLVENDKNRYVLSICDEKSMAEVQSIAELLLLLENHKFPAPRLISAKEGNYVVSYNGKPVILKKYIDAKVHSQASLTMLEQLGETLAKLHKIPSPKHFPKEFSYGIEKFPEVTQLKEYKYSHWLAKKLDRFKEIPFEELPQSIIHGDLFIDNALFANEKLEAILDFEEVCCYYSIFDIGMCIVGTCGEGQSISLKKSQSFLKGYQKIRKLTVQELQYLPLFCSYAATATSFWRFRQFNIRKPDAKKANAHQDMQQLADEVLKISQFH